MKTLYLEWGSDLVLTPKGSIQLATGWDENRQRIERRMLTWPLEVLPDGTAVAPDYIFDTDYGIGLPKLVGQPITQQLLGSIRQRVNQGVMVDAGVSNRTVPGIQLFRTTPGELLLIISVPLQNQPPGRIAVQF